MHDDDRSASQQPHLPGLVMVRHDPVRAPLSERSEHLIERAAAKLRETNGAPVPNASAAGSLPHNYPTPAIPRTASTPAPPPSPVARAFEPIKLPAMDPPQQPPQPRRALRTKLPDQFPLPPSENDAVAETFTGPIPAPARPLTRPILATIPPALSISTSPGLQAGGLNRPPSQNGAILNGTTPNGAPADRTRPNGTDLGDTTAETGADATATGPAPRTDGGIPSFGVPQVANKAGARGGMPALPASRMDLRTPGSTVPGSAMSGATIALQPPPIVQLDALERAGMVVARTTRTRISEEYRIAIGRILRVLHETTDVQGARNVVMVTSARPGEGKSFTALNLAGSIAQNGTDAVLLVDVDPKVKPLSDQLGLGEVQGFLDLVSDPSLRPEDLLRVTAIPNLAIMPVGTRLGGAAQTIGGTASMRPIIPTITRLARRFPKHLIMLDAPPCLSTSDPHTLAPHVGQVILVVEAERTQRSEVEAAVDLVRVCPSITLLLNKVRMTTSHTFGAYDYFGSYT